MNTNEGIRRRLDKRFPKLAVIGFVICCLGFSTLPAQAFDILLGVGERGTFSYFTGRIISRIINQSVDDVQCKIAPAMGDVDNLTNLRGGSLDVALIDSRTFYDALNKKERFEFLDISYENLRVLTPLYQMPYTLVVRNDAAIAALDDIKGERLNAGAPMSAEHLVVDAILEMKGWTSKDFELFEELPASHSQDSMAFCHGSIQAMIHIGMHPNDKIQQLLKLCQARLINMNDADIQKRVKDHPGLFQITIPAHVYASQPEEVATFGVIGLLVASEDMDEQTVVEIIKALYQNGERLQSAHPALTLAPKESVDKYTAGGKLHAGAVKFFQENN